MTGAVPVVLCAIFIFYLSHLGYGLSCLSCQSTNITSRCREGHRSKSPKLETCYGRKAKCYAAAIVNEYGEATFQRGCSKFGVCTDDEESEDVEFCMTCQYSHCNYEFMELDEEVEDYLLGRDEPEEYDELDIPPESVPILRNDVAGEGVVHKGKEERRNSTVKANNTETRVL